ncbi:NAD(P)/FAD-dependent oxidoreductase [Hyphomicrobium sp.]|uniref:NAD(P)/FAD-dependent oxidoreductase n=1 Tax=Hyphomicrobium sp. TaxID=82 RepID=UPI00356B5473
MTHRVAIIGAGLAGLSCARALRRVGISVNVFEEDHNVGGRIATTCVGSDRFDHGAQYLCAQSGEFQSYLTETASLGYAERWVPRVASGTGVGAASRDPWIVGWPGMSAIVRPLADGVHVTLGRRVQSLERREKGWHLWLDNETLVGPFEAVAIAVPAAQALRLLSRVGTFAAPLQQVRILPCWALMVRIDEKNFPEQDVFTNVSEIVRWIARDNTKPGRIPDGETLVVHASPIWSLAAEQADAEDVAEELWGEVGEVLDLPPIRPSRMTAYLWREGIVDRALGQTHLYCPDSHVGVAGDWCLGGFAEHAFESGGRLGQAIAVSLG